MKFDTDEWADHSRDQEFLAEFEGQRERFGEIGMTREVYVRTRRIDEGLQKLMVHTNKPIGRPAVFRMG